MMIFPSGNKSKNDRAYRICRIVHASYCADGKISNQATEVKMAFHIHRVSPSVGTGGMPSPLPEKLACPSNFPPTVLTQKCRFCHFHAVFGHFVQIVPPLVDPNWETLYRICKIVHGSYC